MNNTHKQSPTLVEPNEYTKKATNDVSANKEAYDKGWNRGVATGKRKAFEEAHKKISASSLAEKDKELVKSLLPIPAAPRVVSLADKKAKILKELAKVEEAEKKQALAQ